MDKKNAWKVEPELIDRFLEVLTDNGFKWLSGHRANKYKNWNKNWNNEDLMFFIETEPKTITYLRNSDYLNIPHEELNVIEVTEELLREMENEGITSTYTHDQVNHPSHYKGLEGLEVRTVQENFVPKYEKYGVMVACDIKDSIKYILRAPDKSGVEDLKKAVRMLNYAIEGWENER